MAVNTRSGTRQDKSAHTARKTDRRCSINTNVTHGFNGTKTGVFTPSIKYIVGPGGVSRSLSASVRAFVKRRTVCLFTWRLVMVANLMVVWGSWLTGGLTAVVAALLDMMTATAAACGGVSGATRCCCVVSRFGVIIVLCVLLVLWGRQHCLLFCETLWGHLCGLYQWLDSRSLGSAPSTVKMANKRKKYNARFAPVGRMLDEASSAPLKCLCCSQLCSALLNLILCNKTNHNNK